MANLLKFLKPSGTNGFQALQNKKLEADVKAQEELIEGLREEVNARKATSELKKTFTKNEEVIASLMKEITNLT
jgi:hypothetical protein